MEQGEDQYQRHRHDDREPSLGLLQFFEFAGPFNAISGRKCDIARDPSLRLGNRAAEVTTTHTKFDRNESLIALTEDIRRAGIERDGGKVAQRDIRITATIGRNANLDPADNVDLIAKLGGKPNKDAELAVALEDSRGHRASQRRLYNAVYVAGVEAVARRLLAIDRNVQVGLPENAKDAEIVHAVDLIHLAQDRICDLLQHRQVGADDFDGVVALHA